MAAPIDGRRVFWWHRKVDVRLPGKGNSNSYGARPVHQIILMRRWTWTSRLSIKRSLSSGDRVVPRRRRYLSISFRIHQFTSKVNSSTKPST